MTADVIKRARILSVDVYGKEERNRAALIAREGRLMIWNAEGVARVMTADGKWVEWLG